MPFKCKYRLIPFQKAAEEMMKEFGCVLPFLLPNYSQPVCKLSANDIRRPGQKSIWDLYELVSAQQRSLCQMPCKKMSVIFGVVDESLAESDFYHNRSYYQIYLKSTVRYTETVADYPITTMLAGMKLESESFRNRSGCVLGIWKKTSTLLASIRTFLRFLQHGSQKSWFFFSNE